MFIFKTPIDRRGAEAAGSREEKPSALPIRERLRERAAGLRWFAQM
jgi:hypothetical protein